MGVFKEFKLPENPDIPDYSVKITDFGAIQSRDIVCTKAVNDAIEHCSKNGGGRVIFPKGEWYVGAIHLKDNIEVHFEKDSYVLFSREKEDYLPCVYTSFEGIRCFNYSPLIYGYKLKNVKISGEGILDGNGSEWWSWKINDYGINSIYTACMNDTPVVERVYGTPEFGLRPCFIQFAECENVLIEGVTVKNSPFWNVHPVWCNNVIVRKITVDNPFKSPNTDSINIEASKNVLVENCTVLGGGDDIFTLKAGRGADGWNVNKPCENVVIRNCRASDVNGGGIVIGSEMSGGVKNILAQDCIFKNIMNGVKIKSKKGRGGYVKNIEYRNITAENLDYGINVTLKYAYDDQFAGNGLEKMPLISDLYYENLKFKNTKYAIFIEGVDGCTIKNVFLNSIECKGNNKSFYIEFTENICADNVIMK